MVRMLISFVASAFIVRHCVIGSDVNMAGGLSLDACFTTLSLPIVSAVLLATNASLLCTDLKDALFIGIETTERGRRRQ